MSGSRILCLGMGEGWHADQLRQAARDRRCDLAYASYESLASQVFSEQTVLRCEAGRLDQFDAILTRTMPAGSLETVTFRLAILHHLVERPDCPTIVNPPRSLELAIDKFATLARVQSLGFAVPETIVVQTRAEAMDAWNALGEDCIVKPLFGGEGRGVLRVSDRELAWTVFSTLERLDAVLYVQRFIPPGGSDFRFLLIGDQVFGLRRENPDDFRANVAGGGRCERLEVTGNQRDMAQTIARALKLTFAAIDLIEDQDGSFRVIEVNAIPGWKGAQQVIEECIADRLIHHLESSTEISVSEASIG